MLYSQENDIFLDIIANLLYITIINHLWLQRCIRALFLECYYFALKFRFIHNIIYFFLSETAGCLMEEVLTKKETEGGSYEKSIVGNEYGSIV